MTGGKFANGAITDAFSMMFNDMMHDVKTATGNVVIVIGGIEVAAGVAMLCDDASGIGVLDDLAALHAGASGLGLIALGYAIKTDGSDLRVLFSKVKQKVGSVIQSESNASSAGSPNPWGDDPKKASLFRKLERMIRKGQLPKNSNIERMDPIHTKGGQPHAHFKNGAINQNGTIKEGNPWKNMTRRDIEILNKHGFNIK